MKTKRSVVAVVSAVSMAAFANFEWPDAAATPEPVIPSGETVEVTDAAVIDAYTSVTVESGATLQLPPLSVSLTTRLEISFPEYSGFCTGCSGCSG